MKNNMIILAASLLSTQAFAVQEIPDTTINNVAMATIENDETVIRYNPETCEALGSHVCKFFLSREYGHISLDHPLGGDYTVEEEYAADCWVTQNAPEHLAKAAYTYFINEGQINNENSSTQRAESLSECPKTSISEKPIINDSPINQIQAKSHFNHYLADRVFRNIEQRYSYYFPYSGTYAWEYNTSSGYVTYDKKYYNGSALSEYRGQLFYKVFGSQWFLWGPIANWSL